MEGKTRRGGKGGKGEWGREGKRGSWGNSALVVGAIDAPVYCHCTVCGVWSSRV